MTIGLDLAEKNKVTPELLPQDVIMGDPACPSIVSVCSLSEKAADSSNGQQETTSQNEQTMRKRKIKVKSRSLTRNASRISNPGENENIDIPLITLDDDDDAEGNQERSSQVKAKKTKLSGATSKESTLKPLPMVPPENGFPRQVVENNIPAPESDDDVQILDDSSDESDSGSGSSSDGSSSSSEDDDADTSKKKSTRLISSSSSSTTSSDEGSKDCVPFAKKFRELFGKAVFGREVDEQEADIIIPLDDDDDHESRIELNERGEMKCRVCPIVFKNKNRYLIHRRRHFALDHFICPTCSKGFIKFSHCQAHELREHHEDSQIGSASYAFRARNASNFNETGDLTGEDLSNHIVISSSLYPYRGPPVDGPYTPYEIELKYSRSERKSHSTIAAKYTLECQRKRKQMEAANQLRINKSEQQRARRTERSYQDDEDQDFQDSSDDDLGSDSEYIPNILKQSNMNKKKPTAANTSKKKPAVTKKPGKRKWYYCDICDCQGYEESEIQKHARLRHPNRRVSDVVKFIHYDPKIPETSSQGKSETKSTAVRKTRQSNSVPLVVPSISEDDRTKKNKLKIPKERRRVWETKHRKRPKQVEFLFSLGLVKKSDVIIGPREGTTAVVSSLYRKRKGRRERSLSPGARISMDKMSNTRNKSFRVCPYCDYYSVSKSDIRRHRGEAHGRSITTVSREKMSTPQISPSKKKVRPENSEAVEPIPSTSTASEPCIRRCRMCQHYSYSNRDHDAHIRNEHGGVEKSIRTIAMKFIH